MVSGRRKVRKNRLNAVILALPAQISCIFWISGHQNFERFLVVVLARYRSAKMPEKADFQANGLQAGIRAGGGEGGTPACMILQTGGI